MNDDKCPTCGSALTVVWRLVCARPGTFSLAGAQTKFSAADTPFLVCPCGFEARGKPVPVASSPVGGEQ